jgi:hypothetical protein
LRDGARLYVFFIRWTHNFAQPLSQIAYRSDVVIEEAIAEVLHGSDLYRRIRRLLRSVGVPDPILRKPHEQGTAMNWVYWLSGLAALGIFIYLLIALFKPELFS